MKRDHALNTLDRGFHLVGSWTVCGQPPRGWPLSSSVALGGDTYWYPLQRTDTFSQRRSLRLRGYKSCQKTHVYN